MSSTINFEVQTFNSKLIWVFVLIFCQLSTVNCQQAQQTQVFKPNINRVLFVLDGSGSMKQAWGEKTKFQSAKDLLVKIIDSVERQNPNVEFAVRVFGYQSSREQKNCKDSKLLVRFGKNNAAKIQEALKNITPQGMSPIAYSIQMGAKDFPDDEKSLNSLILITDGEENCEGDPCIASKDLVEKKITLKPFIVGLGVEPSVYQKFNCVGTFFDTKDEASFYNTVGVIIRQTLNTTTVQVNLLDLSGEPTVTNIPFTLYDHYSGKVEYNFVHTLNEKGNPDTLFLDPVGVYDIELHTFPPVRKEGIELTPGKHNIIALDAPAGDLTVDCIGASIANNDAQVIVRSKSNPKEILNVQDLNGQSKYLRGNYELEILTNPETFQNIILTAFTENKSSVSNYGTLYLTSLESIIASVYQEVNGMSEMIDQFDASNKTATRKYQPGEYLIVYKAVNNRDSESTKNQRFVIEDGRTVVLNL
ncbi:MAG: VWA domain-containing protein [Bacteroidetes bacterium]|nr:VWA domain-containing protein [Bacteroidota bacterium]